MPDLLNVYHLNALAAVGLVFLHFAFARLFRPRSQRQATFFTLLALGWLANLAYLEFIDLYSALEREDPIVRNLWVRSLNTISYTLFLMAARFRLDDFLNNLPRPRLLISACSVIFLLPYLSLVVPEYYLSLSIAGVLLGIIAIGGIAFSYHVYFRGSEENFSFHTKIFVVVPMYCYSVLQLGVLMTPPYFTFGPGTDARLESTLFVAGMVLKALHIVGLISLGESVFREYRDQIKLLDRARLSVALADQLAHELNTPAAELRIRLEDPRYSPVEGPRERKRLLAIIEQITGLIDIFERFQRDQRIDRAPGGKVDNVNLNSVCDAVIFSLKITAHPECRIQTDYESGPIVRCVESEMHQVVRNLVKNGIESLDSEKRTSEKIPTVTVATQVKRDMKADCAILTVEDNGRGIHPDVEETLFEDNVSTKDGRGRGHGLFIAQNLVRKWSGTIDVKNLKNSKEEIVGARFELRFPLASKSK